MNTTLTDKTIGAFEARRKFGNMLRDVEVHGDKFVVKRHGQAVAAVVPISVYKQWKKVRSEFFAQIRIAADSANLTENEADTVISDAITAVRTQRKAA